MNLWEITSGGTNDFTVLVFSNKEDLRAGIFDTDGRPKKWETRPCIQAFVDKKRKKQKPLADIAYLDPGTFILNKKAYNTLKTLLEQFGELLELDCDGEVHYFYNVTNLISCVDFEKSEKIEDCVIKATFLDDAIPGGIQIFKDPLTAASHIYVTSDAKTVVEQLISEGGLSGARFLIAGEDW